MTRLRSYLQPVIMRRQLLRKWRFMTSWWGLLLVVSAGTWAVSLIEGSSLGFGWASWFVGALLVGTLGILFHARRKRGVDYQQVARDIEEKYPELHASLLTAVEQKPDPKTGKFNFLQERVINKASEAFLDTGFANAAPMSKIKSLRIAAFALLASICLVLSQFNESGSARNVESKAEFAREKVLVPSSLAELESVEPGDCEVERGSALAVSARFKGETPENVFLVISSMKGEGSRLELIRPLKDLVFWATLPRVDETLSYRIEYDGRQSGEFLVKVFEYPELVRADAKLDFPTYTGISDRLVEDTRSLSVVEGTKLSYLFRLNKPVESALLRDDDNATIELKVNPLEPLAELPATALRKNLQWRLELADSDGRMNKVFPRFDVAVYPNMPPKIRILAPRGDQQVSPLEEVSFLAEIEDDFGLLKHGISYNLDGGALKEFNLSKDDGDPLKAVAEHMISLEEHSVKPGQLVSWFFWAEDRVGDGDVRRTYSDMFFAEIRPFEEIFRKGQPPPMGEEQEQQQNLAKQAEELIKLQKQIVNATWKLHRTPVKLEENAALLLESQYEALEKANQLLDFAESEEAKEFLRNAASHMEKAVAHLTSVPEEVKELLPALSAEQAAYQALLGLLAHEFEVSRGNNSRSQAQSSQGQRSERSQSQLDQLDLKEEDDRYETESQARRLQDDKQREQIQVLSRLKDLARRQGDLNEKLKEAENALREAENLAEEEEVKRELKRLRDEQRKNLAELDEVSQRMERQENRSEMSRERQRLEKTRAQMNKATEQLRKDEVSQAIASGAKAQKDLEEMRDRFRERTSGQFAEEMRKMRREARELSDNQNEIGRTLAETKEERKRLSLGDEEKEDSEEVARQIDQQKEKLSNLLEDVREVVEKSELAEPLLNRKLHQSFRQASQDQTEKSLQAAAKLLREEEEALRSYPFLRTLEEIMDKEPDKQDLIDNLRSGEFRKATKNLGDRSKRKLDSLKKGIEQAAESILGNEAEALSFANRELSALEEAIRSEKSESKSSESDQSEKKSASGNSKETDEKESGVGEQEKGTANLKNQGKEDSEGTTPGQSTDKAETEPAQDSKSDTQSQQLSENGSGRSEKGDASERKGKSTQDSQSPNGESPSQSVGQGNASFLGEGIEANSGSRPITGEDNRRWTDRLRDVEESLDLPSVREKLVRVREDMRKMNREFKRHGKEPEWDLVDANLLKPLNELRRLLAQELAKRRSDKALVPIDRDPVPEKFDELVRRYYERLGKGK